MQFKGHMTVNHLFITQATCDEWLIFTSLNYLYLFLPFCPSIEMTTMGLCYKHIIHGHMSIQCPFLCYKPQIYGLWPVLETHSRSFGSGHGQMSVIFHTIHFCVINLKFTACGLYYKHIHNHLAVVMGKCP
jgi:hypothetical protein